MSKKDNHFSLWDGVTEDDFYIEENVEDVDAEEYDRQIMTIFAANVNYFRQVVRLSDSLKPVERRILYTMYNMGLKPDKKTKSGHITQTTAIIHNHGGCYDSLILMGQYWKKAVPYVDIIGSYGSESDELYAQERYTEAKMSKYAYECFFSDYDEDCVEQIFNTASNSYEPMSLPTKFPNLLVNGGLGFTIGNAFCIPPFNINDILDACVKILRNPNIPYIHMIPDLPTGCHIVDDGNLKSLCDNGTGTLKMRAPINVIEKNNTYQLQVTALPWFVSLQSIHTKLVELSKSGAIPIKDIMNASYPIKLPNGKVASKVDYRIIISKNHDPYEIMEKLYKLTNLQKSMGINFKVVLDELAISTLSMKELISSWLDERRSYLRRLYNKKLTKLSARIDILEILLYLLKEKNIEKTLDVIKKSTTSNLPDNLMKLANMNSFQANRIANMGLGAFTKDAKERYKEELKEKKIALEETLDLAKSEKKIDEKIFEQLQDLKKYATPRKSKVISVESERVIADENFKIITTKLGMIKKLMIHDGKDTTLGAFKNMDYPSLSLNIHNSSNLILFDTFGRYSVVPVYNIPSNDSNHYGSKVYDVCGLNGEVIKLMEELNESYLKEISKYGKPYLVTLTKKGYIKKTPLEEYLNIKNTKNIRVCKLRDDDSLIYADVIVSGRSIMIYTKNGDYTLLNIDDINEQSKDAMGVKGISKLKDGDECAGLSVIAQNDEYILVVTEKGNVKKCDIQYLITGKNRVSYLTSLDNNDSVIYASGYTDKHKLLVVTRTNVYDYTSEDISDMSRKSKPKKLVPVPLGNNIITVKVYQ